MEKSIIWALKYENVRLSNSGKWLYWDELTSEWIVRTQKGSKTMEVYRGESEESAVESLIKD